MAWFKVDDKLCVHPKWLAVPGRARGLWVTAGSWCAANETDGRVPRHVIASLGGNTRDAAFLVEAGLWREVKAGWIFHEWSVYQPDAASLKAKRNAEVDGGVWGNHKRWHVARNIRVPGCDYCDGMPPDDDFEPSPPDWVPDGVPDSPPIPPVPEPEPDSKVSRGGKSPKQDETWPPQPCGRSHNPATNCGACGKQRRDAKQADTDALKAKAAKERQRSADQRAARQAEIDQTPPDDGTGADKARAAFRAAKEK